MLWKTCILKVCLVYLIKDKTPQRKGIIMETAKTRLKKFIKESVEEALSEPKHTSPKEAMQWARINGPSDASRKIASEHPYFAYQYAVKVDKGPHNVTYMGVAEDQFLAQKYRDNLTGPTWSDETFTLKEDLDPSSGKKAALKAEPDHLRPSSAYAWALDNDASEKSRNKASEKPNLAFEYAMIVDNSPHPVTREGASKSPEYALKYALLVDKGANIVTWQGVKGRVESMSYYNKLGLPAGVKPKNA